MDSFARWYYTIHSAVFSRMSYLDGLPPLAFRLFLSAVFWESGKHKIANMGSTIDFFSGYLGLPYPGFFAHLVAYTEAVGALALLLGLATRWVSIPLMVIMLVAIFAVHWPHGWAAIANPHAPEIAMRLEMARNILQEFQTYNWLTEKGNLVIFNNGIEFAATYFVMLFSLLLTGGGRLTSVDYYLSRLWPSEL